MANTTTITGRFINIAFDNATDWLLSTEFPDSADVGLFVKSITFIPNASDDKLVIRNGSITGTVIYSEKATGPYDTRIRNFGGACIKPYIESTDCSTASCVAVIELM